MGAGTRHPCVRRAGRLGPPRRDQTTGVMPGDLRDDLRGDLLGDLLGDLRGDLLGGSLMMRGHDERS